eukprot:scaffold6036_cov110-Isochrysis_galbana.AAC.2
MARVREKQCSTYHAAQSCRWPSQYTCTCAVLRVCLKSTSTRAYGSAPWVSPFAFAFARPDVRCAGARHITQLTGRTPSRELVARALVCP